MADRREQLANVFRDTQAFLKENRVLAEAAEKSARQTKLYAAQDYPALANGKASRGELAVTNSRTFEGAFRLRREFPDKKIAVLNFASATRPGGGVQNGSTAQEESRCRCSTLYPALNQPWLWVQFYNANREARNPLHTDDCIYSPGVVVCKSLRRAESAAFQRRQNRENRPQRIGDAAWAVGCAYPTRQGLQ